MRVMPNHEYLQHQCDKCEEYTKCPMLDAFLKLWRENREMKEYITDGCDLAKCCWKFKEKK